MNTLFILLVAGLVVSSAGQDSRSNRCPDPNSFGIVCIQYFDQCQQSSECPKRGQTCCLIAGCGKQCIVSSTPRPPCPAPNSYGRQCFRYFDSCKRNSDCRGQSCCLVQGCGHTCIDTTQRQTGGRG